MISLLGKYILIMVQTFRRPVKFRVFWGQLMDEFQKIGVESLGIVAIISTFMGAVLTMQVAFNLENPLISRIVIGYTVRQSIILEFAPTVLSLILAGKVGSRIASEIGTMRVTEQIDALQTMGVNSANFLILPKLIAALLFNPVLITMSMALGLVGGLIASQFLDLTSMTVYIDGLQAWYDPWSVTYALIKTVIFAFIIVSVSAFNGYIIKGGALEVGKASTKAVVQSSILIILFNLLLTEILL